MEALLTGFWQAGGLGGASPSEAFTVRCDRSTMSQNDIDAGRLIVERAAGGSGGADHRGTESRCRRPGPGEHPGGGLIAAQGHLAAIALAQQGIALERDVETEDVQRRELVLGQILRFRQVFKESVSTSSRKSVPRSASAMSPRAASRPSV